MRKLCQEIYDRNNQDLPNSHSNKFSSKTTEELYDLLDNYILTLGDYPSRPDINSRSTQSLLKNTIDDINTEIQRRSINDPSEYQSSDELTEEEYPLCYAKDEKEIENESKH